MKITHQQNYNIVYDEDKDPGSGSVAIILAKAIKKLNIDKGLEDGEPFVMAQGVTISNSTAPSSRLIVLSINKANINSSPINLSEDITYVIQFILNYFGYKTGIREVRSLTKSFKKTESFKKYLMCLYSILCDKEYETAHKQVIKSTSYGVPFYRKVIMVVGLISNLNPNNIGELLHYRTIWGESSILSILTYLTSGRDLPEYIIQDVKDIIGSSQYKINLINLSLAIGRNDFSRYSLKILMGV